MYTYTNKTGAEMILVIATQDYENYAAHEGFDGSFRWKAKGGSQYKVVGVPEGIDLDEVVGFVRGEIEQNNDYFQSTIIGYGLEADDWMSDFEKSQLEYEGRIAYPEPTIDYSELKAVFDHEYAEWAADQDAIHYGA
jgi:hypothetical protein